MKRALANLLMMAILVSLFSAVAYSIGGAGDTEWPKGVTIELQLKLVATSDTNGQAKISGELLVRNPGDTTLTIQDPHNRLVLTFVVFDRLGNTVRPAGRGKVDPRFRVHDLPAHATFTQRLERLEFLTGSGEFGYDLTSGKTYRVVAVYRPAGPHGPGFTSQETILEIPK